MTYQAAIEVLIVYGWIAVLATGINMAFDDFSFIV